MKCYISEYDWEEQRYGPWRKGFLCGGVEGRGAEVMWLQSGKAVQFQLWETSVGFRGISVFNLSGFLSGFGAGGLTRKYRLKVRPGWSRPRSERPSNDMYANVNKGDIIMGLLESVEDAE